MSCCQVARTFSKGLLSGFGSIHDEGQGGCSDSVWLGGSILSSLRFHQSNCVFFLWDCAALPCHRDHPSVCPKWKREGHDIVVVAADSSSLTSVRKSKSVDQASKSGSSQAGHQSCGPGGVGRQNIGKKLGKFAMCQEWVIIQTFPDTDNILMPQFRCFAMTIQRFVQFPHLIITQRCIIPFVRFWGSVAVHQSQPRFHATVFLSVDPSCLNHSFANCLKPFHNGHRTISFSEFSSFFLPFIISS